VYALNNNNYGYTADSYHEYLLKMYILWGMPEYWHMFVATYTAIQIYIKYGDWYTDVVFTTGSISYRRFESLMAFWPAVLVLLGDLHDAGRNLNAFYKGVCVLCYCATVYIHHGYAMSVVV
jgi:Glycosyl hydrolase family 47